MAMAKDNNKTPQSMAKPKMQNRNGNDKGHTRENIDKRTMTHKTTDNGTQDKILTLIMTRKTKH